MLLELDGLSDCGAPGSPAECVVRKYTWGLDLAGLNGAPSRDRQGAGLGGAGILPAKPTAVGLLEGAGGIGGLLAAYDANRDRPLWYFYDANGNVGINFVDAALSKCCMARGALPTRMPKLFEEAKLCCERCKWMNEHGCNGGPGPGGGSQ